MCLEQFGFEQCVCLDEKKRYMLSLFVPELRVSCLLGLTRPAAAAKHPDHVFITSTNLLT